MPNALSIVRLELNMCFEITDPGLQKSIISWLERRPENSEIKRRLVHSSYDFK